MEIKGGGGYEVWGGRCLKNVYEKFFIIKKVGIVGFGGFRGGLFGGRD